MDLSPRFAKLASGNIAPIDTLEVGRRYLVTHAQRQETQYGPDIVVTMRIDPTNDVKVFVPKHFTDVFGDSDIDLINIGTHTYHLVSHGRYPNGRSYKLTLED